MPRALFQKTGNAIYISHLDLMRLFQRAFKRADCPTLAHWRAECCPLHPSPFHGAPPERQAPLQRKEFPRQKNDPPPKESMFKTSN